VKISDYEKEVAEEFAPEEMKHFNELNKVIEFMEGPALDTLSDIYIGMNERYISGKYEEYGKNAKKQYKQDRERAKATESALVGFIKDLKKLRSLGRSDERNKVQIKTTQGERSKQRKELFGSE
tara:strand:+ start:59 stop:430 length:372 start_codon:yes stop_codon:yes gene_type:complete